MGKTIIKKNNSRQISSLGFFGHAEGANRAKRDIRKRCSDEVRTA